MAEETRKKKKKGELAGPWAALLRGQQKNKTAIKNLRFVLERDEEGRYKASWAEKDDESLEHLVWSGKRRVELRASPSSEKAGVEVELLYRAKDESKRWCPPDARYDGRKEKGALSLLQSHLQKAVRRGKAQVAAQTARELLAIKFGDNLIGLDFLLRRFPIICVEDATPRPEVVNPFVWFLLAGSDYKLCEADVNFLLGAVFATASDTAIRQPLSEENYLDNLPLSSSLALSLLARAAYGGMKGDVDMLFRAAANTSDNETETIAGTIAPLVATTLPRLRPNDWIPEGVDFHCKHGEIIQIMKQRDPSRFETVDDNDISDWMWHTRSSVNVRKKTTTTKKRPREPHWAGPDAHDLASQCALDIIKAAYKPAAAGGKSYHHHH